MQTGLYETILTDSIQKRLEKLSATEFQKVSVDLTAEHAATLLSNSLNHFLYGIFRKLGSDKNNGVQKQLKLFNSIIEYIDESDELDLGDHYASMEAKLLKAVIAKAGLSDRQLNDLEKKIRPVTGLTSSSLFTGSNCDLALDNEIERDILSSDQVYWLVSFIRWSGLRLYADALKEYTKKGNRLNVLTTTYMGASDSRSMDFLTSLPNTEVKVSFDTQVQRLHAKSYIFQRDTGFDTCYIGSSNLSKAAHTQGLEWNVRVTAQENKHLVDKALATFDYHWNSAEFKQITSSNLEEFRNALQNERFKGKQGSNRLQYSRYSLFAYQKDILDKVRVEREIHGNFRNLIVAATGTGKTVISAFDYKRFGEKSGASSAHILFVAHRKEILTQALSTYRSVLGPGNYNFGDLWTGDEKPLGNDLSELFITVDSLSSNWEILRDRLDRRYYDYIVIDEAHHSTAESYRKIFEYFQPQILVGLTATPERMDGISLLGDFGGKISAEIRLHDAMKRRLLTPFHYFCVADDVVDLRNVKWCGGKYNVEDLSLSFQDRRRSELINEKLLYYLQDPSEVRALCFCVSKAHAEFMAEELRRFGYSSDFLHSGRSKERGQVLSSFRSGETNYLCVVDIFNEGVDIPEIDTVLFLRPTESLTVYLQQLGRGLRIAENKEYLTVMDFVAQARSEFNYASRFAALTGTLSATIEKEVGEGFPHLPPGCSLKMEELAQKYIVNNIKSAIFNKKRLKKEIATYYGQKGSFNLNQFLQAYQLDVRLGKKSDLGWFGLKCDARINLQTPSDPEKMLLKALFQLYHVDDPDYIEVIRKLSKNPKDISDIPKHYLEMFYFDLCFDYFQNNSSLNLHQRIFKVLHHELFREELAQVAQHLFERLEHSTEPYFLKGQKSIRIHSRYSRNQLMSFFGLNRLSKKITFKEGVKHIEEEQAHLMFVTLDKSDGRFSPTTQYEDYAVSEKVFHWQSQNTASEKTSAGRRYIFHRNNGTKMLLFVRENTKNAYKMTEHYIFLGEVDYQGHRGAKPMSINWELKTPMLPSLWKHAAKMATG